MVKGSRLLVVIGIVLIGCADESYFPKPKGWFRIELPKQIYQKSELNCPFYFEYHQESNISSDNQDCWFNVDYPRFNARVHFSYKQINSNFQKYVEDTRTLAYKHTVKATNIEKIAFNDGEKNVHALTYLIEGNTASSVQFYITDSVNHFVRGALYFNSRPNEDSLLPVINYIKEDMNHLISTFYWSSE